MSLRLSAGSTARDESIVQETWAPHAGAVARASDRRQGAGPRAPRRGEGGLGVGLCAGAVVRASGGGAGARISDAGGSSAQHKRWPNYTSNVYASIYNILPYLPKQRRQCMVGPYYVVSLRLAPAIRDLLRQEARHQHCDLGSVVAHALSEVYGGVNPSIKEVNPLVGWVMKFLGDVDRIRSSDLSVRLVGGDTRRNQMLVGQVLRDLGWSHCRCWIDGERSWWYFRPGLSGG